MNRSSRTIYARILSRTHKSFQHSPQRQKRRSKHCKITLATASASAQDATTPPTTYTGGMPAPHDVPPVGAVAGMRVDPPLPGGSQERARPYTVHICINIYIYIYNHIYKKKQHTIVDWTYIYVYVSQVSVPDFPRPVLADCQLQNAYYLFLLDVVAPFQSGTFFVVCQPGAPD